MHVVIVPGRLELLKTQFTMDEAPAFMQVNLQQHPGGSGIVQKNLHQSPGSFAVEFSMAVDPLNPIEIPAKKTSFSYVWLSLTGFWTLIQKIADRGGGLGEFFGVALQMITKSQIHRLSPTVGEVGEHGKKIKKGKSGIQIMDHGAGVGFGEPPGSLQYHIAGIFFHIMTIKKHKEIGPGSHWSPLRGNDGKRHPPPDPRQNRHHGERNHDVEEKVNDQLDLPLIRKLPSDSSNHQPDQSTHLGQNRQEHEKKDRAQGTPRPHGGAFVVRTVLCAVPRQGGIFATLDWKKFHFEKLGKPVL